MTFKEIIQKIGEKNRARKELLRQADEQDRIHSTIEERKKSANERELERFMKENREEQIKGQLDVERKKRRDDISFNHNPLHTKNIMKAEWEVLREKNMFAGNSNMFSNQEFIHKNNPNLLKNNMRLLS
ncbi:MAG TPA: hypothetical protein ENG87_00515 [Candidatus Pacearchaeota archaeon]|nr:hypothetical protein BMS3Abin17_00091 [archaeon BMS3Abin17]HDK41831.1 hypothetical protein [Candidatus Pacearchaeota archaeon]HDZ60161.1 hypothetical protein [Candidatus Pacearchaeota archaeon]